MTTCMVSALWDLSVSFDLEAIFKQTPSFPLYGGIKWKRRSLFKNRLQIERNTLKTDSAFSTLCPHKVEKTESV